MRDVRTRKAEAFRKLRAELRALRTLVNREGPAVIGVDWGKGESYSVEKTHAKPTR